MNAIHQTKQGFWVLDNDPYISKWCEDLGRLDHDRMIDILCDLIPVGGVAIDAGAAIGDHTVFYGHRVGSKGLVLAYEPNPDAYACLVMNTREQPWVHPYRMGLSAFTTRIEMDYKPENIWASQVRAISTNGPLAMPIDSIADAYCLKRLDFLKMDVEGFEPQVLIGAYGSISKFRPIICAEINKGALARHYWTAEEHIYKPLASLGYRLEMIDKTHTLDLPQFDCLFLPK
ncbi:MAG TPA: FkbM family methyltransferase [Candidatus Binatia bacterium]|nr:FkbM family methyltransferase [Candidatus Binatia bacterium]